MTARKGVLLSILFVSVVLPLRALELNQGRIKLTLSEDVGRFTVSYLTTAGSYVPLLSPQDPRTTMVSIVLNNSIFRMGESAGFASSVEKTPTGVRYVWKSDFLTVTESFSFVSSVGAQAADGVRIDLTLRNTSREDFTAGIRYLFDTWLGETGPTPFLTDVFPSITKETTLTGRTLPRWWVSPRSGDPEQLGLQCMVTAEGITQPDKIVFANWKRLSDAPWSYSTSDVRDFSLLPYSKNDSAVAEYFGPHALPQGSQLTVTIVFGKYNPAGFPATAVVASGDFARNLQQTLEAGKSAQGPTTGLRADLGSVDAILSRVDAALAPGASISESDVSLMESALVDLKARASTYSK